MGVVGGSLAVDGLLEVADDAVVGGAELEVGLDAGTDDGIVEAGRSGRDPGGPSQRLARGPASAHGGERFYDRYLSARICAIDGNSTRRPSSVLELRSHSGPASARVIGEDS